MKKTPLKIQRAVHNLGELIQLVNSCSRNKNEALATVADRPRLLGVFMNYGNIRFSLTQSRKGKAKTLRDSSSLRLCVFA